MASAYLPLLKQGYLHFRPSAHYQTAAHYPAPAPIPIPQKTAHSNQYATKRRPALAPAQSRTLTARPRFFLHLFSFFCTLYKLHIQTIYPPSATCSHLPRQGFLSFSLPAIHFAPPCTFHLLHLSPVHTIHPPNMAPAIFAPSGLSQLPPPPRHPFRSTLHFSFIAFIPLSNHSSTKYGTRHICPRLAGLPSPLHCRRHPLTPHPLITRPLLSHSPPPFARTVTATHPRHATAYRRTLRP